MKKEHAFIQNTFT